MAQLYSKTFVKQLKFTDQDLESFVPVKSKNGKNTFYNVADIMKVGPTLSQFGSHEAFEAHLSKVLIGNNEKKVKLLQKKDETALKRKKVPVEEMYEKQLTHLDAIELVSLKDFPKIPAIKDTRFSSRPGAIEKGEALAESLYIVDYSLYEHEGEYSIYACCKASMNSNLFYDVEISFLDQNVTFKDWVALCTCVNGRSTLCAHVCGVLIYLYSLQNNQSVREYKNISCRKNSAQVIEYLKEIGGRASWKEMD
eukprot:Pompholyxophrys_punicea_v1_NODE_101_length_3479_cov_7.724007.p1 type:complete len:253 gc:universal NODE_101_length_3479_cov_7.724007:998-240(-)